ncbi:PREDICTED: uncharacterized protein LOC108446533 isoform X3 [Corvus brachyrhynchos]|uniref:uncharacterized protein LOC108446533 isoform X3 n=1 Tax=Corvus brachyrhynchos TaxID=85066 RepID=UPI0008163771|nr:PREDICTED: uncharacterized protein LOC108446533 isoform X3 [Corvus brachyrhynchos]
MHCCANPPSPSAILGKCFPSLQSPFYVPDAENKKCWRVSRHFPIRDMKQSRDPNCSSFTDPTNQGCSEMDSVSAENLKKSLTRTRGWILNVQWNSLNFPDDRDKKPPWTVREHDLPCKAGEGGGRGEAPAVRAAGSSWWTWMGCNWVFGAAGALGWMQRELQIKREMLWSWIPRDGALGQHEGHYVVLYWEKKQQLLLKAAISGLPAELHLSLRDPSQ